MAWYFGVGKTIFYRANGSNELERNGDSRTVAIERQPKEKNFYVCTMSSLGLWAPKTYLCMVA